MTRAILQGKRALVTGATGGLGRAVATELRKCGCSLYLTATNEAALSELAGDLCVDRTQVSTRAADVRHRHEVEAIIADVAERLGGIDILVNCAGLFPVASVGSASLAEFDDCMAVNVRAPFLFCQAFSRGMVEREWGRIVNIGSSSAYHGFENTSVYCASKHALLGLSRALHAELRSRNVRTFCLSPGSIRTPMGRRVPNQDFATFIDPAEIAEYLSFVISFDGELVSDEIRLNRMIIR